MTIPPAQFRAVRQSLNLSQWDFALLLGVSQSSVTLLERGRAKLPRKALPAYLSLVKGLPASPQAGDKLTEARKRLNLAPDQLAAGLSLTLAAYSTMEGGGGILPWSVLLQLSALERAAGFPPTFSPGTDAPPMADPLLTLSNLATMGNLTPLEEYEQADREEEGAKAAASAEAIRKEWRAKGEERRRQARENAANPEPLFDDL